MSRACPATTKHRTQNGRLTAFGTVILCSSGTPGASVSVVSRTGTPSVALVGITRPGEATIRTLTPEQPCSEANTTFFARPPNGPTAGKPETW